MISREQGSTRLRPPFRSRGGGVSNLAGPQVLADRNDDFAAAIDHNARAGPLETWADGNLDNRNGEQRSKKENHRSHVIPRQVEAPGEVTISGRRKNGIKRTLQKCILAEN